MRVYYEPGAERKFHCMPSAHTYWPISRSPSDCTWIVPGTRTEDEEEAMYWVHYKKDDKHHYTGPFERFMEADHAAWNIYLDYSVWGAVTTNTQWLERNAELHRIEA